VKITEEGGESGEKGNAHSKSRRQLSRFFLRKARGDKRQLLAPFCVANNNKIKKKYFLEN
jgi:hypothetical protein